MKRSQPFKATIHFADPDVPDLGLSNDVWRTKSVDGNGEESSDNGTSDVPLITIADRDGSAKVVRADERFWWEEDQEKELAEYRRKSAPIQVKTFEC
jgi:hypothetical protein